MSSPRDVEPAPPGPPAEAETFVSEESRQAVAEARADAAASPRRRGPRGMRSMLWSLLPLVALIVVMVVLFEPREDNPPATIDPGPAYSYAAQQLSARLPQPSQLPAGWRATSADVATAAPGSSTPPSLRVGYLTAEGKYVELFESDLSAADVVDQRLNGAAPTSVEEIDGRRWQRYPAPNGEAALIASFGTVTVLVTGNAGDDEMTTLINALS